MSGNELLIELGGSEKAFAPGGSIDATALWALAEAPRVLEARLFWFTRGKGSSDVGIVARETIAGAAAAGQQTVRFRLPEGPYSFSGKLISIVWAVELVAEPVEYVSRAEFVMAPEKNEVQLTPIANGKGTG
jgi:hypothetical protein